MRLLLITNVYPSPRRPTKGTFNRQLVAGLREAGDEVSVIVPIPWTDLLLTKPTGVAERDTQYPTWWYPPKTGRASYHRWMSWSLSGALLTRARAWRPDLILAYWTHPDGTVAMQLAQRLGIPGVILAGGTDIQLLTRQPARRRAIVNTLNRAARVLTVGAPLRTAAIELGIDPERIGVFERGVDRTQFFPASPQAAREQLGLPLDRPIFLWVGRMVPVKGLDVLFASWSDVAHAASAPMLVLVGDGELERDLRNDAVKFGNSVRFVGSVDHSQLAPWYCAADCVVLPSRSEGVPNVLIEGLACGTPFVASAVGGITELVDGESVAVPPEDVAALSRALLARAALPPMSHRSQAVIVDRRDAIAALRAELARVMRRSAPPARAA